MNLEKFTGPGSTPSRRRFWNNARDTVISLQKVAGRNVSTDEHPGEGTVINIARDGGGPPTPTGACCTDGDCTVTTEADCAGTYQGDGTTCDDVDCGTATSGACCVGTDCSIETPFDCTGLGGTYQGDDTTCSPNPCEGGSGACCEEEDCTITTAVDCTGTYYGDNTICEDFDCAGHGCPPGTGYCFGECCTGSCCGPIYHCCVGNNACLTYDTGCCSEFAPNPCVGSLGATCCLPEQHCCASGQCCGEGTTCCDTVGDCCPEGEICTETGCVGFLNSEPMFDVFWTK